MKYRNCHHHKMTGLKSYDKYCQDMFISPKVCLPCQVNEVAVFKFKKSPQKGLFGDEKIEIESNLPCGYRVSCRCSRCKRFASHQAYLANPNGYTLEFYKHTVKRIA